MPASQYNIYIRNIQKRIADIFLLDLWYKFRKETAMKHHVKTVKHQLEAKKYTIRDESRKTEVILIEADLLNEIQTETSSPTIEATTEQTNEHCYF